MEDQKLPLSPQIQVGHIPEKWREKFSIKRIDEDAIEITIEQRDAILIALNKGQRFIQVGKYTLMLNGIKSIDPKWGAMNIPPKPRPEYRLGGAVVSSPMGEPAVNQKEIDEWEELFEKKK